MAITLPTRSFSPVIPRKLLEFPPQILPIGTTEVFGITCRLRWFMIGNPTGGNINVSVQDEQVPSGVPIMTTETVVPGGVYTFIADSDDGYPCINGLTVTTSAPGISGYFNGMAT